MIFEVEMLAFGNGKIREVEVMQEDLETPFGEADQNYILEQIYRNGQTDLQHGSAPAVSMGDVIRFKGQRFEIAMFGFKKL